MEAMTGNKGVPQLRFREFGAEWAETNLNKITELITKGTTPKIFTKTGVNYVKIEGLNGIHIRKEKCLFIEEYTHYNPLKRSILKMDDILFAIAGATVGKVGVVTSDILPANTNQALAIIRLTHKENLSYVLQILQSTVMRKYIYKSISVGAQPNLNLKQINDFSFHLPTLPEQQKIATFLSSVDEKLQQLTKKKSLLADYKKGLMQKIFSQELRFKDANGKNYPDWEEKKLGEVLDYEQPTKYIVKSTEYHNSYKTPVLTAGKSFILGYTDETECIFESTPVIIFDDFTMSIQFVTFPFKVKSSAMKILKPVNQEVNMVFVHKSMQMIKYPKGDEHKRFWISEYSKIKIKYPSLEEQQQIANFLSALDSKIVKVNSQIENTKAFKKGLLQQMFV